MPPALRIRPYKDFLTPLLHRRFARATSYIALLCYAESIYIGGIHSWFWSWFPLGRVGVRSALIFIPAFMIFILRVSQLHVGNRTSDSAWHTARTFPAFHIIQTLAWYLLSAFLFGEVFMWCATKESDLGRVKYMPKTERPTLNEKPIYLTCYMLFLAVIQAGLHIYLDYDRVDIRITKDQAQCSSTQDSHQTQRPADLMSLRIPGILLSALKRTFVATLLGPLIYLFPFYFFSIRSFAWALTRSWARVFYSLPKSGALPIIKPFHLSVLWSSMSSGFMLVLLWELGNVAFSVHVAQAPLKNDRPITYESRDPNGSLLTGLRGKKLQTRAFAFWELLYIAQRFEGRRRAIYDDLDRQGGSTWSQILEVSLNEIAGISNRIREFEHKSSASQPVNPSQLGPSDEAHLPRLTRPLTSGLQAPGDILTAPSRRTNAFETKIFTKNQTASSGLSPKAKAMLNKAENSLLSTEQQARLHSEGTFGVFRENVIGFLRLPIGKPFRQEYRRRMAAVILGQPHGDAGILVDAVDALTRLTVSSLTEDKYGNVQKDVRTIIQAFTTTLTELERFKVSIGTHWTDICHCIESPETEIIVYALKSGLNELVDSFGDYSEDLCLSQSELRRAREAARQGDGQEMQQSNGRPL